MKQIWFIHGAASSPLSFNWLKSNLFAHTPVDVAYSDQTPVLETINLLRADIAKCFEPPVIVAHSLGGVIAASIAQTTPVDKIVTLSSPFGGSFAASLLRWVMPTQIMRDISHNSPITTGLLDNPPTVPILSFVTHSHSFMTGEPSDGVVTVRSQKALKGPTYVTVPYNHFEVLMAAPVAVQINEFVFGGAE